MVGGEDLRAWEEKYTKEGKWRIIRATGGGECQEKVALTN
jgi:hypothetical protein